MGCSGICQCCKQAVGVCMRLVGKTLMVLHACLSELLSRRSTRNEHFQFVSNGSCRRKEAAAKSRQDAKRPNVIISERWDKKAARWGLL